MTEQASPPEQSPPSEPPASNALLLNRSFNRLAVWVVYVGATLVMAGIIAAIAIPFIINGCKSLSADISPSTSSHVADSLAIEVGVISARTLTIKTFLENLIDERSQDTAKDKTLTGLADEIKALRENIEKDKAAAASDLKNAFERTEQKLILILDKLSTPPPEQKTQQPISDHEAKAYEALATEIRDLKKSLDELKVSIEKRPLANEDNSTRKYGIFWR